MKVAEPESSEEESDSDDDDSEEEAPVSIYFYNQIMPSQKSIVSFFLKGTHNILKWKIVALTAQELEWLKSWSQ